MVREMKATRAEVLRGATEGEAHMVALRSLGQSTANAEATHAAARDRSVRQIESLTVSIKATSRSRDS